MRSPRLFVVAATVVLCTANLSFTLLRSTIPLNLDGRVHGIVFITEKHPGIDDIYVLTVEGAEIQVDPAVALEIDVGDHIDKAAWSTEMVISDEEPQRSVRVQTSRDFNRMVLVMPLVALTVATVAYVRRRSVSGPRASASGTR